MRLQYSHTFEADAATVYSILQDPEYEVRLKERTGVDRQFISEEVDGEERTVRRQIVTQREVPKPMRKAAGMDRVQYEQISVYNDAERVLKWRVVLPGGLGNRATIQGTTTLVDTDGGCERAMVGEISIRIPLVGGKMEKKLAEGIGESYAGAAEIIAEMVAERA